MLSDRHALKAFLLGISRSRAKLVRSEIDLLEPLCKKADNGFFDLMPANAMRKDDVRSAVGAAVGRAPDDVAFVSLADGAADRDAYWGQVEGDLGEELRSSVCGRFSGALSVRMGAAAYDRMQTVFWETLGEPLWHAFEVNRWDDIGQRLRLSVRAGLLATSVHFLGFVAVGDAENAERLRPLLRLFAKTAVLGRRKAEPETMIAIVA